MGLRAPRNHEVGIDVAGVVEAVGPDVTRFKPGDEVFTDLFAAGRAAPSPSTSARARRRSSRSRRGMSFEDAATLPHSAVLALQGLRLRNGRTIKPGDKVLIDGASGNVGPFAVQIAKSMGAEVTGVCQQRQARLRALARRRPRHRLPEGRLHEGGRALRLDRRHRLAPLDLRRPPRPEAGGVYVTLGGETGTIFAAWSAPADLAVQRQVDGPDAVVEADATGPTSTPLKELIAAGKVRPVIDRRYPLDQIVDALRCVDDGQRPGKVVINVDGAGT